MNLLDRFEAFYRKQPAYWIFAQALVLLGTVGFLDYITGVEVAMYPFYAIPILFMVWLGDRFQAVVICVLCEMVWWWTDALDGHVYEHEWLRAWDAFIRLLFFLVVTFAGAAYKQQRATVSARVALLERSRRLEQEIIAISERERQGIGRDLHDGMCQYLAAIGLTADLLRQNLAAEGHPRAHAAGEIANLLQDSVERAREIARGLSPVDRDEGGLESALEELANSTTRLTGVQCAFLCAEPVPIQEEIRAIHLFRVAQEAVSNATRHGRARNIIVALEAGDGEFALRISDDGRGFDANAAGGRGGMGLNIMRYRARMIGGTLEIYPNAPVGTVVACTVQARPASGTADSEGSLAATIDAVPALTLSYGNSDG
jgi:signal transduction histidine kinase